MDEDCLRLDVYTPERRSAGELLPVMVFLHGGSLVEGSGKSIQSGYGAVANIVRLNVISVAVNYRLAVLGFLALHATAAADSRKVGGNYGLLDCVAALRWVQDNVAAFGGDPTRVTVYGQSSGGSLVLALAASPLASGLFHVGISMSGSPRLSATADYAARLWHREVVNQTRCSPLVVFDTPQESPGRQDLLRCLRSLDKTELIEALPSDWDDASFSFQAFSPSFRYAPLLVVDGADAVPSDYLSSYRQPHARSPLAQGVTLVIGVEREEIDFAPADDVRAWSRDHFKRFLGESLQTSFGDAFVDQVIDAYGLSHPAGPGELALQQVYAQIVSDATIYCPSLVLADAFVAGAGKAQGPLDRAGVGGKSGSRLYVYSTSQAPGSPGGFCPLMPFQSITGYCPRYAFHAWDLFSLLAPDWKRIAERFGGPGYNRTAVDDRYGQLLAKRFAALADKGSVDEWAEYSGGGREDRFIIDLASPGEASIRNLRQAQCSLWRQFYDQLGLIN